jgi:gliding motility-associated-like protein
MRLSVILVLSLLCSGLHAQNLYNAGSVISISQGGVVYVKDTIINAGTIINNGDMQIGGSWINQAQYDAGNGQITFNSNLPQIINHNDQSFSRLTISGGGQKIFLADITIENELNLLSGILVTENDSRIVMASTAQIVGGSDVSHVQGPVYHKGSGDKLFPMGNGEIYLPVELLNVEGENAEIGLMPHEPVTTVLLRAPSVAEVSTNRFWEVDLISGSLSNAHVTLPVKGEAIVKSEGNIVVSQADGVEEKFESIGQSDFLGDAIDGRVTSEEVVSKKLLAVATVSEEKALIVYNAISPNGDGPNDFLIIDNIQFYEKNTFTLFNRWGDKVFEIEDYDNKERVFRGKSNIDGEKDLVNGTYFYSIKTQKDGLNVNGFIVLKR